MARTKAKSSGRRARRQTATKRRSAAKATSAARQQTKPRQRFVVSHHREEDFEGGLRRYAKYRDLGIARATNGMVRAHVIRFVPPGPASPAWRSRVSRRRAGVPRGRRRE